MPGALKARPRISCIAKIFSRKLFLTDFGVDFIVCWRPWNNLSDFRCVGDRLENCDIFDSVTDPEFGGWRWHFFLGLVNSKAYQQIIELVKAGPMMVEKQPVF